MRENDSAVLLARAGYRVEQKPVVPGRKEPDYRIEGRIFDNYAPSTSRARNIRRIERVEIWDLIRKDKVVAEQASRIILNLYHLDFQMRLWGVRGVRGVRGGRGVRSGRSGRRKGNPDAPNTPMLLTLRCSDAPMLLTLPCSHAPPV